MVTVRTFMGQVMAVVGCGVVVVALMVALMGASCQGGAEGGASGKLKIGTCATAVASYSGDLLKVTAVVESRPHKLGFTRIKDLTFGLDKGSGIALNVSGGSAELGPCEHLCPAVKGPRCVRVTLKTTDACLSSVGGVICGVAP